MEVSFITFSDLRVGSVIAEDIRANTKFPIISKNTTITHEHFEVLKAFKIIKVPVFNKNPFKKEDDDINGSELSEDVKDFVRETTQSRVDFRTQYNEAVMTYKNEFLGWQSGKKIEIAKLRVLILPLVDRVIENKEILPLLNEYSEPNDYLYHHSIAVGIIAGAIADKMNFSKGQVVQLAMAGLVADSGMSKIDMRIREKTAFLTDNEFNEIRKHTIYSYQMVKEIPLLKSEMKMAIFQHHERLDGSGYPRGERMEQISILSQIIAVADVFHAMTSERVYRSKESPYKVVEMIREEEFGKFSIEVVEALIGLIADIPIGTKVRLSNGEIGEVIFVHRDSKVRPMVRLLNDQEITDLSSKRQLYIERVLSV